MGWHLDTSYLNHRMPLFAGKNGGGGNRTRVGSTPETLPMQELLWAAEDAWRAQRDFVLDFQFSVYEHRDVLLSGSDTNVYAVFSGHAVKIGHAAKPLERATNLQIANPNRLIVFAVVPATTEFERFLHVCLQPWRIHGEWFRTSEEVLAVAELLISAHEMLHMMTLVDDDPIGADDTWACLIGPAEDISMGVAA